MAKKIIQDITANTVQVTLNQCCNLLLFYLISVQLTKEAFGELNWYLALLLVIFGVLSMGLDQLLVKRTAAGERLQQAFAAFQRHVLVAGTGVYALLLFSWVLQPANGAWIVLLLGAGKVCLFFASPIKQVANGLQQFRLLLWMNSFAAVSRTIILLLLSWAGKMTFTNIVLVFMISDMAEFLLCMLLAKYVLPRNSRQGWNRHYYISMVKEVLPQSAVVLLSAVMSRADWLLLGLMTSPVVLAHYSFAYRVFEAATIPLLMIAPLLLPRFSKIQQPGKAKAQAMVLLLRTEMIIAGTSVLILNCGWTPVIDWLTDGKYGAVNQDVVLVLSASIPFLYLNNFLWTKHFSDGRLGMIFRVFLCCCFVNIAANILLIPSQGAMGAAWAFLISSILQSILFLQQLSIAAVRHAGYACFITPFIAITGVYTATSLFSMPLLITGAAVLFYIALLLLTRQFGKNDVVQIRKHTGW